MTDPVTMLLNAPPVVRRAIACALLALVAAVAIGSIAAALGSLPEARDAVQTKRETLGRLSTLAAMKPALLRQASEQPLADPGMVWTGESIALVQADLLSRMGNLAAAHGAILISAGNAPEQVVDGVRHLGLRADITGTVEAVHGVIRDCETSIPPLIVRKLAIWVSTPGEAGMTPTQLTAQLHLQGALDPELPTEEGER